MAIDITKNYMINEDIIFNEKDNGKVVLVMLNEDDDYYEIEGLASKLFMDLSSIDSKFNLKDFYQQSIQKYNPPKDEFEKDFNNFFQDLIENNVIIAC